MKIRIGILIFILSSGLLGVTYEVPESAEAVPVPSFIDLDKANFDEAPDKHKVVRGDTLWDLSETYLKSPWYWPKVWSINPQISNPHLIYPGDFVYFRGSGEMFVPKTQEIEEVEQDDLARSGKTLDVTPDNFKSYVTLGGKYNINK